MLPRRKWLEIIFAIALQFIAFTSAHDTSLLAQSQELTSHSDYFTLEKVECSACPPENCTAVDEVFSFPDNANDIDSPTESPITITRTILECEKELEGVIADQNRTIQRMEREYRKVLNETYHKLDVLEEKLGKQERQMKTTEERFQTSRRQLSEVDEELRRMHAAAVRQYLNTTLMREDAWKGIRNAYVKAARRVDRRWGHHFHRSRQLRYITKQKWYRLRMKVRMHLQPRMVLFKRNVQNRWSQSTFARPLIDKITTMTKGAAYELYRPLKPIIDEVEVACRLTTISAIEEGSKTLLNFLEKDERLHMEREQARNKRKDPVQRRLELRNRRREPWNREESTRIETPKPSYMNVKARAFLKYAMENSTQSYERIAKLAPLMFVLYLARCCIIGGLSWFIGIPSPIIWAIAICRIMKRFKKTY